MSYWGDTLNSLWIGVEPFRVGVSELFIIYTDVRNASSQYFRGMEAGANRANLVSILCLCFLLAFPFCWWALGQETLWWIPLVLRKSPKAQIQHPVGLNVLDIRLQLWFSLCLELAENWKSFTPFSQEINPSELCVVMYKVYVVLVSTWAWYRWWFL